MKAQQQLEDVDYEADKENNPVSKRPKLTAKPKDRKEAKEIKQTDKGKAKPKQQAQTKKVRYVLNYIYTLATVFFCRSTVVDVSI